MTDAERETITAFSRARGEAQWGQSLHPEAIKVLRRLHASVNSRIQKAVTC